MTFGNDDTFELIGKTLRQTDNSAYDLLIPIVYDDVKLLINLYCRGFSASDKEDLSQEVVIQVFKSLPAFYKNSRQKSVAERNAWLRRIVINKRNDIIRKIKRSVDADAVEYNDAVLGQKTGIDLEEIKEKREDLFRAMHAAFQINTTAEKLLAFVYNCLLYSLSGTNGSPKKLVERFDGVSIEDMYNQMVYDLSEILLCKIPEECLEPLKRKVQERPDDVFSLSARTITGSSNWIKTKVKEQHKNEKRDN